MIRYAVVGAGWISQEAFMPAVAATGNSRMQAIVSGRRATAQQLADFHAVPEVLDYADYDALLASDRIDAVYVALPNSLHADFAIRALRAGKHVLVEKPLATSLEEARAMIAAAEASGRFLMTAYRLHTEPATLAVLEMIRQGSIGDPRFFSSSFSFQAALGNHRLKADHWGGPLQDVGVYCLNAARHVFAAEPVAVQAMASSPPNDPRFAEIGASLAVTLRFPEGKLAQFHCSFGSHMSEDYRVIGETGEILVDPGFRFESALRVTLRCEGRAEVVQTYPHVDHFAGQIAYFSDCILTGLPPEPDGREGLADMITLLAIEQAAASEQIVPLNLPTRDRCPDLAMARSLPLTSKRLRVNQNS